MHVKVTSDDAVDPAGGGGGAAGAVVTYENACALCTLTISPAERPVTTYDCPTVSVANVRCVTTPGRPASTEAVPVLTEIVVPLALLAGRYTPADATYPRRALDGDIDAGHTMALPLTDAPQGHGLVVHVNVTNADGWAGSA